MASTGCDDTDSKLGFLRTSTLANYLLHTPRFGYDMDVISFFFEDFCFLLRSASRTQLKNELFLLPKTESKWLTLALTGVGRNRKPRKIKTKANFARRAIYNFCVVFRSDSYFNSLMCSSLPLVCFSFCTTNERPNERTNDEHTTKTTRAMDVKKWGLLVALTLRNGNDTFSRRCSEFSSSIPLALDGILCDVLSRISLPSFLPRFEFFFVIRLLFKLFCCTLCFFFFFIQRQRWRRPLAAICFSIPLSFGDTQQTEINWRRKHFFFFSFLTQWRHFSWCDFPCFLFTSPSSSLRPWCRRF